jgi:uncharacterized spore protein YtfJ
VAKQEAAEAAARAAASQPADRLVERLAEMVGAKATVQAVFGEPIARGDVTVVPVARVRWGFGGGGGRSEATETGPASGSGGGGGVTAEPVGYLEIGPAGAEFKPIVSAYPSPSLLLAGGITFSIVVRTLSRLLRRQ